MGTGRKYPYWLQEEDDEKQEHGPDAFFMRLLKTRTILLSGEVNKALGERVIRQLLLLEEAGDDPIRVFIDSPG